MRFDDSAESETAAGRKRHLVIYDGDCPLCVFQIRLLTWLDWLDAVSFISIGEAHAAGLASKVSPADLLEAIHCLAKDGKIYRGARCIRFVGMRMPVLAPLALALWLPGVIGIAEAIYRWVSRNRLVLSRLFGCRGACAVLPERRRREDDEAVKR